MHSELLMYGRGVRSILLLSLVASCLEIIYIYIYIYVYIAHVRCNDCVGVNFCCVTGIVKDNGF